jgi:hypothetical protein
MEQRAAGDVLLRCLAHRLMSPLLGPVKLDDVVYNTPLLATFLPGCNECFDLCGSNAPA